MRHFGTCSRRAVMHSWRWGDHRRWVSAVSAMCSTRFWLTTISIHARLARPASNQHLLRARPHLTPAIAIQSDLMAYQGDDPIARELKKNFRAVHYGQRIKLRKAG